MPPEEPVGVDEPSQKTAGICREFLKQAAEILAEDAPANLLTMRGIAMRPEIPRFGDVYGLRPAAIAVYPMYRGLARLVHMNVLDAGATLETQMEYEARAIADSARTHDVAEGIRAFLEKRAPKYEGR